MQLSCLRAHRLKEFDAGNTRGPCSVQDDLHILDLFARDVQRVDQTRRTDHRGAVLVIMEDGNIHRLLQLALDHETLGRLDILEVDAPERRPHQLDRRDEGVDVFSIEFDIDGVHVREPFEEDGFPFHHRFRRQRPKVAQTQHRRPVRDHGDQISLGRVIVRERRILGDGRTGHGDAGRIGQRQVTLGRHRGRGVDVQLSRSRLQMIGERFGIGDSVASGHCVLPLTLDGVAEPR